MLGSLAHGARQRCDKRTQTDSDSRCGGLPRTTGGFVAAAEKREWVLVLWIVIVVGRAGRELQIKHRRRKKHQALIHRVSNERQ